MLVGLLLILGGTTQLLGSHVANVLDQQGKQVLKHDIALIQAMIRTNLQALSREALQINRGFEMNFPDGITRDGGDEAPVLRHGRAEILNGQFDIVDRFTAKTGAVATLFVRKGADLVRVNFVKKENGGGVGPR